MAAEDAAGRFLKLGITLHERGNYSSAEESFRKAISATPEDCDLYLYLGEMLEEKQEWAEARDVYRDASRAAPDFAKAFKNYFGLEIERRYPTARSMGLTPSSL